VLDAIWAHGGDEAEPILDGLRAAAAAFAVPIVGGHANMRTDRSQLSVAILGRAQRLLTSFDARPGDRLVAAIDLRGRYREPFANWEAATDAPPARLRGDLALLPLIAERGLACAAKDISQGGIVGTAAMLAECSRVAIEIEVGAVPKPVAVPIERWLVTFPSFGFIVAVAPDAVGPVTHLFADRGIAAADIGTVRRGTEVAITDGAARAVIRDFQHEPLIAPPTRGSAA